MLFGAGLFDRRFDGALGGVLGLRQAIGHVILQAAQFGDRVSGRLRGLARSFFGDSARLRQRLCDRFLRLVFDRADAMDERGVAVLKLGGEEGGGRFSAARNFLGHSDLVFKALLGGVEFVLRRADLIGQARFGFAEVGLGGDDVLAERRLRFFKLGLRGVERAAALGDFMLGGIETPASVSPATRNCSSASAMRSALSPETLPASSTRAARPSTRAVDGRDGAVEAGDGELRAAFD